MPRIERRAINLCLHFAAPYRSMPDILRIGLASTLVCFRVQGCSPTGRSIVQVDVCTSKRKIFVKYHQQHAKRDKRRWWAFLVDADLSTG